MIEVNNFNVISKEVLTVLSHCDKEIINKIPNSLIKELVNCAADSNIECVINSKKNLEEQNISEESKDLIALMYYSFIASEEGKKEIKENWDINEAKYQEELKDKYNVDNIFKNKNNINNENMSLVEYKEDNIFVKFIKKIIDKFKK